MFELFLAIISGVGLGLAFLSPSFSFLVWFSLIPLFFLLSRNFSFKRAYFFLIFGAIYYGLAIHWITQVTFLGFFLLLFYLALFYFFFYFLGSFFIKKPLRFLTIPAAWVIIEFLKEVIWCGFGWANLGYSQFEKLYLIQIADLGGTKLISFVIVLVNFLVWELIVYSWANRRSNFRKFIFKRAFSLFFIFLALFSYSFFRLRPTDSEEKISVSLIQPNILGRLLLSEAEKKEALDSLASLVKKTPEDNLVIFSEAAWPYTLDYKNTSQLKKFAKDSQRDILIGVINQRNKRYYNSAFFLNRHGRPVSVYDKIVLVPFGEYVPLRRFFGFIEVLNQMADITPGKEQVEFIYQDKKFSVLICFEDTLPLFTAQAARGRDFLVNITDDSWFGGNPEATQHLAIMVLRAVENRIPIVRAANTGISGWVSAQGRVKKLKKGSTSLFVQAKKNFEVPVREQRSFYNHSREWLVVLSFIFLGVVAFWKDVR